VVVVHHPRAVRYGAKLSTASVQNRKLFVLAVFPLPIYQTATSVNADCKQRCRRKKTSNNSQIPRPSSAVPIRGECPPAVPGTCFVSYKHDIRS
jgi:hypothetical protein